MGISRVKPLLFSSHFASACARRRVEDKRGRRRTKAHAPAGPGRLDLRLSLSLSLVAGRGKYVRKNPEISRNLERVQAKKERKTKTFVWACRG